MQVNAQALLEVVPYLASPNVDDRPNGIGPEVLIIHAISLPPGEFGGDAVEQLFTNTLDHHSHLSFVDLVDLKVSAHVFIRRDGSVLQFVPFDKRAWHAGISEIEGRDNVNDFSIGIELEGSDEHSFIESQYRTLAEVTRVLLAYYPVIDVSRIYGHADIAPDRKTDPGPHFDWQHYRTLCRTE